MNPGNRSPQPDPLIAINLDDLLDSLGLASHRGSLLRWMLRPAAQRFARTVRAFDNRVGSAGLAAGGAWMLQRMAGGLQVAGRSCVPASGPLLVLANHPGMADTAALFASLAMRPDLFVIAQDRPFLRALPHVAARVLFVGDDALSRTRALRQGIRHLQRGGALLTFPAGAIEPDPAAEGTRRSVDALQSWSASFALLLRAVPHTEIVLAIVSQVVSADALRNPLTRWRRSAVGRGKLAASLQILWRPYQAMPARVAFAAVPGAALHQDATLLRQSVLAYAGALMTSPPTEWET